MRYQRFLWIVTVAVLFVATPVRAAIPNWLPRYDLQFDLDTAHRELTGHMQATWTNHYQRPVHELVFNAHSHYVVPAAEIGFDAKMLELLRMDPDEVLGVSEPPCDVDKITLTGDKPLGLPFHYEGDTKTTLVVPLPFELKPGEAVTIDLAIRFHIPAKQGRWGQWRSVTTLSNWLPVFAVYDETQPDDVPAPHPQPLSPEYRGEGSKDAPHPGVPGRKVADEGSKDAPRPGTPGRGVGGEGWPISNCWQPTPFIPWHQPFFNEAGIYHVRATLPCNQKIGCSGAIVATADLGDGRQQVDIVAEGVRDFAFLCSERYCVYEGEIPEQPGVPAPIKVRVLAFREHAFFAKEFVRIASEAIIAYSRWFGPYPYPVFTIPESFFGWNGNECGSLVMVDERVFGMPHLAVLYADYLLSHEVCHQWWYNLIGTNGYCETWMDEALATFYSNKLQNEKHGRNNELMTYPRGLEWAPNIRRDDYHSYSIYGALGRGENCPIVQEMPKFGHLANLFSMCYDKGSRVVATIEERLTEPGFASFMRIIYKKYQYRILRVADYQRELEAFTGDNKGQWDHFFKQWLYGVGLSDWAVEKVEIHDRPSPFCPPWLKRGPILRKGSPADGKAAYPVHVTVHLKQRDAVTERTSLGFSMPGCEGYPIRVPIIPEAEPYHLDDPPCEVIPHDKNEVRVEIQLPAEPEQIAVDPDQILVDTNPANNFWRAPIRWRLTPVYTFLEETDLTNAYDRWNVIAGPWVYGTAYSDAWYTRSTMFGARAGLYRTQEFDGGVYAAYRTDFRDVVVGADGLWLHTPYNPVQIGYNIERRIAEGEDGNPQAFRASTFTRYVFLEGDSLYLPPTHYLEAFASYQDNFFPYDQNPAANAERPEHAATAGLHYHLDYRTPYWTPAGGFLIDAAYATGVADLDGQHGIQEVTAQASYTKSLPDLTPCLAWAPQMQDAFRPALEWLSDSTVAVRAYGATAVPTRGLFFTLGGSDLFRGFDLSDRQGSTVWVGSVEWRMPLARGLTYDMFDHIMGLRNVYGALFYDVGDAYTSNHSVGSVAHAVGGGLRLDVSWFSFVERTTFRFDVAKTVNESSPLQVWIGVGYPF